MAGELQLRPIGRDDAARAIREWHSHHRRFTSYKFAIGGCAGDALVAVVVVGRPVAPEFQRNPRLLEVIRLAVGPDAPHCAASRLLGAAWRSAKGMGVRRMISYTRANEDGTCYRAAGWVPTARVKGREHTTGNRSLRWLPGLYEPSTEVVDRIRWEIGPERAEVRRDQ